MLLRRFLDTSFRNVENVRSGMELVEIFEDGSEESLTSFMDVEVARKPVMRTSDGGGGDGPSESERPMPLVPVRRLPTTRYLEMKCPVPKLMLWVDGMLAPALNRPLFINLSGAFDLGVSRPRPTPTPWPVQSEAPEGGKRRSLSESGGACDAGMGSDDDNDDGSGDECMMHSAVNSSGRGAASHVDLDEVATHRWHGQRRPSSATSWAATTAGGFSSPSAGSPREQSSPPMLPTKRTRPVSAWPHSAPGTSQGDITDVLGDVLGEWQLESPPKRASLLHATPARPAPSRTVDGRYHAAAASDEGHSDVCGASGAARKAMATEGAATAVALAGGPTVGAPPAAEAAVADSKAPSAVTSAPSASAALSLAASSSTAAPSTGDLGAESGAQPPAPPPSPVVGRSVPRDVFGGTFKRKLRDEHSASSAINSMMRSMENDLLAMHLEARPAKFMRCTSGFA